MVSTIAIRFRQTGRADAGKPLHSMIADHPAPCRHCLAESAVGTPVLLGSYHFGRPYGVCWTPSPIFLHAEPASVSSGWTPYQRLYVIGWCLCVPTMPMTCAFTR